ncbi:MAG TPA: hypothetical protein VJX29_09720 [Candidatus Acidoferrales bacterium]|nr:hypothetical protein [Candidatus Acidoferrales bacterium]
MIARRILTVTALVAAFLLAGLPGPAHSAGWVQPAGAFREFVSIPPPQSASAPQPASAQQPAPAISQPAWVAAPVTPVDTGFRLLYQLKFSEARAEFAVWEKQHPEDPMGYTAEAASYLFEEFNNQGVLTSEFFLDDKRLLGGIPGQANQRLGDAFRAAVSRAQKIGQARLDRDPRDPVGLLTMTMTNGMLADYTSLIEKRQLATLHLLGVSEGFAQRLLAVDPGQGDAYVALGVSNYILACLPAYKRFFLRMGGVHGDKGVGMRQLEQATASGHYLQPYAELLVALTSLREKRPQRAQALLAHLSAEFPENPLFARELAKLGAFRGPD